VGARFFLTDLATRAFFGDALNDAFHDAFSDALSDVLGDVSYDGTLLYLRGLCTATYN
jgi:hypothetical protein